MLFTPDVTLEPSQRYLSYLPGNSLAAKLLLSVHVFEGNSLTGNRIGFGQIPPLVERVRSRDGQNPRPWRIRQ